MEKYYAQRGAEIGHDMLIEFESESINLRIDKKGVITEDHVWKIIPLTYPPKVSRYSNVYLKTCACYSLLQSLGYANIDKYTLKIVQLKDLVDSYSV